jgi:hypothetical protein
MRYMGKVSEGDIPEGLSDQQKTKLREKYQKMKDFGNYQCMVCGSNNAIKDGFGEE